MDDNAFSHDEIAKELVQREQTLSPPRRMIMQGQGSPMSANSPQQYGTPQQQRTPQSGKEDDMVFMTAPTGVRLSPKQNQERPIEISDQKSVFGRNQPSNFADFKNPEDSRNAPNGGHRRFLSETSPLLPQDSRLLGRIGQP